MIFGDPYKFAIQIDFVEAWNIGIEDEGIFNFLVNGYYQPNTLANQSLTILDCFDSLNSRYAYLKSKNIYPSLYHKSPEDLYAYMNNALDEIYSDEGNYSQEQESLFHNSWLGIPEIAQRDQYWWIFYSEDNEKIFFLDNTNKPSNIILDKGYSCKVMNQALLWAKKHYINEIRFNVIKI